MEVIDADDLADRVQARLDDRYVAAVHAIVATNHSNIALVHAPGLPRAVVDWYVILGGTENACWFTPKEARNVATRLERHAERQGQPGGFGDLPKDLREAADEAMERHRRGVTHADTVAKH